MFYLIYSLTSFNYFYFVATESIEEIEPLSPELYLETTASNLNAQEIVPDASLSEETFTEASYSEESFSEEHSTPPYSIADDFVTPYMSPEDIESNGESLSYDETTTLIENSHDNIDEQEDILLMYERADITNEADYEIRGQIDELDEIVNKVSFPKQHMINMKSLHTFHNIKYLKCYWLLGCSLF